MVAGENIYYNAADLMTSRLYEFGAGPLQDTPGHQQIQVGGIFLPWWCLHTMAYSYQLVVLCFLSLRHS